MIVLSLALALVRFTLWATIGLVGLCLQLTLVLATLLLEAMVQVELDTLDPTGLSLWLDFISLYTRTHYTFAGAPKAPRPAGVKLQEGIRRRPTPSGSGSASDRHRVRPNTQHVPFLSHLSSFDTSYVTYSSV